MVKKSKYVHSYEFHIINNSNFNRSPTAWSRSLIFTARFQKPIWCRWPIHSLVSLHWTKRTKVFNHFLFLKKQLLIHFEKFYLVSYSLPLKIYLKLVIYSRLNFYYVIVKGHKVKLTKRTEILNWSKIRSPNFFSFFLEISKIRWRKGRN